MASRAPWHSGEGIEKKVLKPGVYRQLTLLNHTVADGRKSLADSQFFPWKGICVTWKMYRQTCHMPGTVLSALQTFTYSPQQSHEIGFLIILILQIRKQIQRGKESCSRSHSQKLRHKKIRKLAKGHTVKNQGTERLRKLFKLTQLESKAQRC